MHWNALTIFLSNVSMNSKLLASINTGKAFTHSFVLFSVLSVPSISLRESFLADLLPMIEMHKEVTK